MTRIFKDVALISAAFAASMAFGMLTNALRKTPLPMVYENREARLLRAVSGGGKPIVRDPEILDFETVLKAWKDSAAVFVDAREPAFFEEGHIPRSVNLPRERILQARTIGELADKARPLIVYCSEEDCDDGAIVAKGLLAMGHSKVSVYSGGWAEWSASGSPVEK